MTPAWLDANTAPLAEITTPGPTFGIQTDPWPSVLVYIAAGPSDSAVTFSWPVLTTVGITPILERSYAVRAGATMWFRTPTYGPSLDINNFGAAQVVVLPTTVSIEHEHCMRRGELIATQHGIVVPNGGTSSIPLPPHFGRVHSWMLLPGPNTGIIVLTTPVVPGGGAFGAERYVREFGLAPAIQEPVAELLMLPTGMNRALCFNNSGAAQAFWVAMVADE